MDEVKARSTKWCIDSVTRGVRRCVDPKEDAKKAKQDEAGIVIPDAIVGRRQKKKEKTFEYEIKWQFKSLDSNCWVEKDIVVKMGYLNKKYLQRQLDLMPRGASAGRRSEMEEPSRPPLSLSGLLSSYQGYFIRLVPRLACQIVCNVRCYMY